MTVAAIEPRNYAGLSAFLSAETFFFLLLCVSVSTAACRSRRLALFHSHFSAGRFSNSFEFLVFLIIMLCHPAYLFYSAREISRSLPPRLARNQLGFYFAVLAPLCHNPNTDAPIFMIERDERCCSLNFSIQRKDPRTPQIQIWRQILINFPPFISNQSRNSLKSGANFGRFGFDCVSIEIGKERVGSPLQSKLNILTALNGINGSAQVTPH